MRGLLGDPLFVAEGSPFSPSHTSRKTVVYPALWVAPSVADVKINWIGG